MIGGLGVLPPPEIISMKRGIEVAKLDFGVEHFFQALANALGKIDSSRLHAQNHRIRKITMVLDEMLTQPADCDLKELTVEQESFLHDQASCKYKIISLNPNNPSDNKIEITG
ncbi:hypothetical protein MARINOS108_120382 [Marinoscillum sp. 108]|nr:hypothetical protein MARINOS108_120382 [Marinoscillum sp. 108]